MLAHGLAASPEERGSGGWAQANRREGASLGPLLRGLALGLEGGSARPGAAQQASGHIVGTVNAANV
jgi:hypothetical protein